MFDYKNIIIIAVSSCCTYAPKLSRLGLKSIRRCWSVRFFLFLGSKCPCVCQNRWKYQWKWYHHRIWFYRCRSDCRCWTRRNIWIFPSYHSILPYRSFCCYWTTPHKRSLCSLFFPFPQFCWLWTCQCSFNLSSTDSTLNLFWLRLQTHPQRMNFHCKSISLDHEARHSKIYLWLCSSE